MRTPGHRAARRAAAVLAVLAAAVPGVAAAPAVGADSATPAVVCRTTDPRLTELSGLAPSLRHPGVLWTHNDSGGGPVLYALDATTCAVRAVVTLADTPARDLEGIAVGRAADGAPTIWVGDIGDNRGSWPYVRLHAFTEPAVLRDTTLTGRTWRLTYAGGPGDAEALLADPRRERLWIVTKAIGGGRVYALPSPLPALPPGGTRTEPLVLALVGEAPGLVNDGAVAPDASRWVLRGYVTAVVRAGLPPGGALLAALEMPAQPQGEAVAWAPDGTALLTVSERDDALWRVPLPRDAWAVAAGGPASPSPTAPGSSGSTTSPADLGNPPTPPWVWVAAVVAVGFVVAFVVVLVRGLRPAGPRR